MLWLNQMNLIINSVISAPQVAPIATISKLLFFNARIKAKIIPITAEIIWSVAKKAAGMVIAVKTAKGI